MEKKFKYKIGLFLIFGHLAIILSLIVLRLMNCFLQDEFTTILGIMVPMFTGFSTSIVNFIISDRANTTNEDDYLSVAFRTLSILFPAVFIIILIVSIWLQANKIAFSNFEDFKAFVLSIESLFSAYCGYFVFTLFKKEKAVEAKGRGRKRSV